MTCFYEISVGWQTGMGGKIRRERRVERGNHGLVQNIASLMSVSRGSRKVDDPDLVRACFTVNNSRFKAQLGTVEWHPSRVLRWYSSANSVKMVTVKARLESGRIRRASRHPEYLRASTEQEG